MKKTAVLCCLILVLVLTVSTVSAFAQGIEYSKFVDNLAALVNDEPNLPSFDPSSDALSTGVEGMIFIGNNVQLTFSLDSSKSIEKMKFISFPSSETKPPLVEAYHAILCVVGALADENGEKVTGELLLKDTSVSSLLDKPATMQETIEIEGYTLNFSYYGESGLNVDMVAK